MLRRMGLSRKNVVFTTFCLAFLFCVYLYYDLHSKLKDSDERTERMKALQNSLSTQLQVVYEHKSRLEKAIQDEKENHRKTKEAKQDFEQKFSREKKDIVNQYNNLNHKHGLLQGQLDDVQKELSKSESDYQEFREKYNKVLDEYKEKVRDQSQQCNADRKYLNDELMKLKLNLKETNSRLSQCEEAEKAPSVLGGGKSLVPQRNQNDDVIGKVAVTERNRRADQVVQKIANERSEEEKKMMESKKEERNGLESKKKNLNQWIEPPLNADEAPNERKKPPSNEEIERKENQLQMAAPVIANANHEYAVKKDKGERSEKRDANDLRPHPGVIDSPHDRIKSEKKELVRRAAVPEKLERNKWEDKNDKKFDEDEGEEKNDDNYADDKEEEDEDYQYDKNGEKNDNEQDGQDKKADKKDNIKDDNENPVAKHFLRNPNYPDDVDIANH